MTEREDGETTPGFFEQLFSATGRLDRGPYAVTGLVLALLKHQLDRIVAHTFFGESWAYLRYYVQPHSILEATGTQQEFLLTMGALAVPFAAIGVWLTARRLNSVGWPPWWSLLFFVPFVNFVLFLVLSLVPTREGHQLEEVRERADAVASSIIPESALGSVGFALVATVPFGVVLTLLGVWGLEVYGWGLFLGIPFWLGLASAAIYGYGRERGYFASVGVALLSTCVVSVLLVGLAVEGVVCVVMAAPLGFLLAIVGGTVGHFIQSSFDTPISPTAVLAVLAGLPFLIGLENVDSTEPPELAVETSIDIDAPPEVVWDEVVTFEDLPEPSDWIFGTGIAYPTHAEIDGRGPGAVRRCVFSTGAFVEPVTAWEEPRRLAFDVREQPPAMEELSPWGAIDAPHVDSFFQSQRGEFRLIERPDGGTRLVGTTWYRHRIWPVRYWRVWTDRIVRRIHLRVLRHIERKSEGRG